MSEWLQTLVEFLKSLKFWCVIPEWQGAIQLRWGRLHKVLTPGLHWTIPVADTIWEVDTLTEPKDIGPLPLTTRDGISVTCSAVITWEVLSVERFQTSCKAPAEALHDVASGALAHAVLAADWLDVPNEQFLGAVCLEVRKRARKYGIRVLGMQWTGLVQCRPLVLWSVGAAPGVTAAALSGKAPQGD